MNLAVGFFDGVHLGHRRILSRADAALTFLEHPSTVFAPGSAPPLLMSASRRIAAIAAALGGQEAGPDRVRALPFTRELAATDSLQVGIAAFARNSSSNCVHRNPIYGRQPPNAPIFQWPTSRS